MIYNAPSGPGIGGRTVGMEPALSWLSVLGDRKDCLNGILKEKFFMAKIIGIDLAQLTCRRGMQGGELMVIPSARGNDLSFCGGGQ